ncbi:hypothetical protein Z950_182 [Sulfitobacter mediterraneus KCTC 32188]|nr:hypothetical protein Z950_182 [Sulfitobacter mediterraneus KCTC 32188]
MVSPVPVSRILCKVLGCDAGKGNCWFFTMWRVGGFGLVFGFNSVGYWVKLRV